MFGFKYSKKHVSNDYKETLEIYAAMDYTCFEDLPKTDKEELLAAWLADADNEDERLNLFVDFANSPVLSEMMYGSLSEEKVGKLLKDLIMSGDHIKSINADMDEAFGDYLMTLDGYVSDDDALRVVDNIDRVKCARMGF